jgi:hypothetical protein
VADAHEAAGEDVEQEAAQELLGGECHHLALVAIGGVSPAEADDAVSEVDDAVVREGDAVGVAAEVLEDLFRPGEGLLGVDDPGLVAEGREEVWVVWLGG